MKREVSKERRAFIENHRYWLLENCDELTRIVSRLKFLRASLRLAKLRPNDRPVYTARDLIQNKSL